VNSAEKALEPENGTVRVDYIHQKRLYGSRVTVKQLFEGIQLQLITPLVDWLIT